MSKTYGGLVDIYSFRSLGPFVVLCIPNGEWRARVVFVLRRLMLPERILGSGYSGVDIQIFCYRSRRINELMNLLYPLVSLKRDHYLFSCIRKRWYLLKMIWAVSI